MALGAPLAEMADRAANIGFSRFRGERLELGDGIVLVNDCYNANPVSMRAALDHLASLGAERGIAVLGEMAELGTGAAGYHREIGAHARAEGVDFLVGVGEAARDYGPDELVATPEDAAELLAARLAPGDAILVKGSRSAGLEAVAETLAELLAAGARRTDGRGADRRHGGDADLHLPRAEVHRVPAGQGVRPAHPRGRAARSTTPRPAPRRWAG